MWNYVINIMFSCWVITLCTYAQQGYAFGCVGLCTYVRICIYICRQKNRLFNALLLENLLLSVICCLLFEFKRLQCGLLRPASCTDRVIHAFPNKTWRPPWPRNIFFWALTAHHTLWARLAASYDSLAADWRVQYRTSATILGIRTRCTCSTLN